MCVCSLQMRLGGNGGKSELKIIIKFGREKNRWILEANKRSRFAIEKEEINEYLERMNAQDTWLKKKETRGVILETDDLNRLL